MARFKTLKFILILLLISFLLPQCKSQGDKKSQKERDNEYKNTETYNFAEPKIIKLPPALDEISGIAYYAKDTSVFAIIDEYGILFKIPLMRPSDIMEWNFDKPRDFEDIVLRDSVFYVLVSNGDIDILKFKGGNIRIDKIDFPNASKKANEFESLYFDSALNRLILMCKNCEADKKDKISSYSLNDSTNVYEDFTPLETAAIFEKKGVKKESIRPSAAAINPITKELYIISSINKLIIISNARGAITEVIHLNPKIYKQPEGMCFTPDGDLIISNEIGSGGNADLLLLKNKKKL